MTTGKIEDQLIDQIFNLSTYSLWFLESDFEPLTPTAKYETLLFTASAVINRLKATDFFKSNSFDTSLFLDGLMTTALKKYNEHKAVHSQIYNTFKHRSAIIESNLNRENRSFFAESSATVKKNSEHLLRMFELEINERRGFKILYTNLYLFPFFETTIEPEEQEILRNSYFQIINAHDPFRFDNFNKKIPQLINDIANKLTI